MQSIINEPKVVLVNQNDETLGEMPKLEAHKKGLLHRAISVFIFNEKGEWLLQKRSSEKYHSGGKWSNTACSHPYPNEEPKDAAERRLFEEMGINCALDYQFAYTYKAKLDNDLTEHEYDHIFFGISEVLPKLNKEEVEDYVYISQNRLEQMLSEEPNQFTVWFQQLFVQVKNFKES